MMINPFRRFLTKEHLLHEACVLWLKVQHAKMLFTHPLNEGRKSAFERFLYKILGVKTGMPDLLIFKRSNGFAGLAIELKIPGEKPTPNQLFCMQDLRDNGWSVHVCFSTDQFRQIVTDYLKVY